MPHDTIRVAHISDLHLGPLPRVPWALIDAKRITGALNWARGRYRVHLRDVAAAVASDIVAQQPDHVAVTGDIANLGLPAEIERGARWLAELGPARDVSVVPGNHDIYGLIGGRRLGAAGLSPWRAHFASSPAARQYLDRNDEAPFPFVRIVERGSLRVAVIGLNSAIETPPFVAIGRLGARQLERVAQILHATGADGLMRVVLIHHPPLPGLARPSHELIDAAELATVLERHGAELVLHGHNHRRMVAWTPGPLRPIPCVGVPSASTRGTRTGMQTARAHIFEIGRDGNVPVIILRARGIVGDGASQIDLERGRLVAPTG